MESDTKLLSHNNPHENIKVSNAQSISIEKMINFISKNGMIDSKIFGLYGYAGTGKTYIILRFIFGLLELRIIRSFIFTALTNKAVIVGKSKSTYFIDSLLKTNENIASFDEKIKILHDKFNITIDFMTIHKLLSYKNGFSIDGQKIFTNSKLNIDRYVNKYDVIVIDECSMLPRNIMDDIERIINNPKNRAKIIMVGDPAQLPPVNEIDSIVFRKVNGENCYTMSDIVRNSNSNVIEFCNHIREWIMGNIKLSFAKYECNKLFIYRHNDNGSKIETEWFERYVKNIKRNVNNSNIILTWTNRQTDIYNETIRKCLYQKKNIDRYEKNDMLLMNEFYCYKDVVLYTSEQLKIIDVESTIFETERFSKKNLPKIKNIGLEKQDELIETIMGDVVDTLNNLERKYKIWHLKVVKLSSGDIMNPTSDETIDLFVLHDDEIMKLKGIKEKVTDIVKTLRTELHRTNKTKRKQIDEHIIKHLWKLCDEKIVKPFADVSYGYAITTHKSQGSTYKNVFVDAPDIFENKNENEAKRCLYTALTRASNKIYMLI